MTRRSVWSDERVQTLLREFIPAADEVWALQNGDDPASRLFQVVAEQGHYAGRTKPTNTRQGIYATAPSGKLLASVNTRSAEHVAEMLEEALEAWETMPDADRWLPEDEARRVVETPGWERHYPEDGLVLKVIARDLPRDKEMGDWRDLAWNQDFAWFRQDEVRAMVPEAVVGERADVPEHVARRLAALHLVDFVRGQSPAFRMDDVETAELSSTVVGVEGAIVDLELTGRVRTVQAGKWSVQGFRDMDDPRQRERGIEVDLIGRARFDLRASRFESLELAAIGTRWGGTQYNGRSGDLEAGPIGFLLTVADENERIAPASIWRYGW